MFTKEELDIIHLQLVARKQEYESMMMEAAEKGSTNRVIECVKYIEKMNVILSKYINNKR